MKKRQPIPSGISGVDGKFSSAKDGFEGSRNI